MSHRRFLMANALGRGIASVLTVIVGAFAAQIPSLIWIAIIVFVVLGIIGWIAARHYAKA
jgi:membrane protein DedA with SNARE-associated domain